MKERTEQKELVVIPIFYKVQPVTVKELKGDFGDKFRELVKSTDKKTKKEWKEALQYVPFLTGIVLDEKSDEDEVINIIIRKVKEILNRRSEGPPSKCSALPPQRHQKRHETFWGIELRIKQLEEKLRLGRTKQLVPSVLLGCPV